MGRGLPFCWTCKHIRHADRACLKHSIKLPKSGGLLICRDYEDNTYPETPEFHEWKEMWLVNPGTLYGYADGAAPEMIAPFSQFEKLDS